MLLGTLLLGVVLLGTLLLGVVLLGTLLLGVELIGVLLLGVELIGVLLLGVELLGVLLLGTLLLGVELLSVLLLGRGLVGADEAVMSGVEIGDVGALGCGVMSSGEVSDRFAAKTGTARATVAAAASAMVRGCFTMCSLSEVRSDVSPC